MVLGTVWVVFPALVVLPVLIVIILSMTPKATPNNFLAFAEHNLQ